MAHLDIDPSNEHLHRLARHSSSILRTSLIGGRPRLHLKIALTTTILATAAACSSPHDHSSHGSARGVLQYYEGVGQYLFHSTEDSRTTVTINHEEIPGFMDAMAMPYLVKDPSLLRGLEPGQDIEFRVVAEEGGFYFIDRITPVREGAR